MANNYKIAKTLDEQIEHLKTSKKVQYNDMNVVEAKEVLLRYNYINVITPYKHHFAKNDGRQNVIKIDGRHKYESDIEFQEYYECLINERQRLPIIAKSILDFDIHFKSILAYHLLTRIRISDTENLLCFLDSIMLKIPHSISSARKEHAIRSVENLKTDVTRYADVYCFFDRMSLGDTLIVYQLLDRYIQKWIFDDMSKFNMTFSVSNISHFIDAVFRLVSIRNCVMHGNSLEILVRFYNPKEKILRTAEDRKRYNKLISKLLKQRKNPQYPVS